MNSTENRTTIAYLVCSSGFRLTDNQPNCLIKIGGPIVMERSNLITQTKLCTQSLLEFLSYLNTHSALDLIQDREKCGRTKTMAFSILRSIYRQAVSGNWAGRSGNWVCRKSRSPMCTVSGQSPIAERISSAAAPWLMLPPTYEDSGNLFYKCFGVGGKMSYNFYSLVDNKVISVSKRSTIGFDNLNLNFERLAVLVGSSHGWLAFYKTPSNLDLFLYNPLSHRHIKLPSVETIPLAEEKLRDCWGRPLKVILSCSPDDEDDNCRAILCFGPRSNMALCCPGQSTKWTPFGSHFHENEKINVFHRDARIVRAYDDFVYSTTQKQLFCVTQFSDFESWDLGNPMSPKLNWKKTGDDFKNYPRDGRYQDISSTKHLVFAEHSNQLFLVRRHIMEHMGPDGSPVDVPYKLNPWYMQRTFGLFEKNVLQDTVPYKTVGFDVHEIDIERGEFKYMDGTLDGMAFFIGSKGHGFVVESPDTVNLKPNSIYYTDPMCYTPAYWDKRNAYGGHDIGIFHYGDRTFSPCYYPCDIQKVKRIRPEPMWFTPSSSPL